MGIRTTIENSSSRSNFEEVRLPCVKINFEYNYLITQENYIFRARYFTPKDIELIKDIIQTYGTKGRSKISQVIWEELNWRQAKWSFKRSCLP